VADGVADVLEHVVEAVRRLQGDDRAAVAHAEDGVVHLTALDADGDRGAVHAGEDLLAGHRLDVDDAEAGADERGLDRRLVDGCPRGAAGAAAEEHQPVGGRRRRRAAQRQPHGREALALVGPHREVLEHPGGVKARRPQIGVRQAEHRAVVAAVRRSRLVRGGERDGRQRLAEQRRRQVVGEEVAEVLVAGQRRRQRRQGRRGARRQRRQQPFAFVHLRQAHAPAVEHAVEQQRAVEPVGDRGGVLDRTAEDAPALVRPRRLGLAGGDARQLRFVEDRRRPARGGGGAQHAGLARHVGEAAAAEQAALHALQQRAERDQRAH
jgi:hypothetical protein